MRVRLTELRPEWLADGTGRERMGLAFDCCDHPDCRLQAWFEQPGDKGDAVTTSAGRVLHKRYGETFENLTLFPPVEHGDCAIHFWRGEISFC